LPGAVAHLLREKYSHRGSVRVQLRQHAAHHLVHLDRVQ
jgi:hypothetical protein